MAEMTPQEQLMLELINRARMDPAGEARRFGIALNEGVAKGEKISSAPKQVLAGNDDLVQAADNHSNWMLDNDTFSHIEDSGSTGFTGKEPSDRMENAGYVFTGSFAAGENIAASFQSATIDDALATKLILQQHKGLFVDKGIDGRGHRLNILQEGYQEIGVGQEIGKYQLNGDTFNTSIITQDFARSGTSVFVTGVVYTDKDENDFFGVGEERAGVAVNGGGPADTTGSGGGYELQYAGAGNRTVTFAGGVSADVVLETTNVKLDLVDGDEIWTNATLTGTSANVTEIHLLGIGAADLHGADSGQAMYANKGRNTFEGNGGADTFVFGKGTTGKTEAKADTIADFSQSDGDRIDLDDWDANTKQNGKQDFNFIADEKFHGNAGELRFVQDGGDTWIQGDVNGDRKADLVIRLDGAITLTGTDFDL